MKWGRNSPWKLWRAPDTAAASERPGEYRRGKNRRSESDRSVRPHRTQKEKTMTRIGAEHERMATIEEAQAPLQPAGPWYRQVNATQWRAFWEKTQGWALDSFVF